MITSESKRLGLNLEEDTNKIKFVNNKAQKIHGISKHVSLQISSWKGNCNLLCVPLDDFDLILDIDFFFKAKVALLPPPWRANVFGGKHVMLCAGHTKWCQQERSAIRDVVCHLIEKSLKQGLQTYVAALVEIKEGQTMEVPYSIVRLLKNFANVMPATLPKELLISAQKVQF